MFERLPHDLHRLRLRLLRRDDLDAFLAYRVDPEVARYQGWEPMSRADAASFLELHGSHAAFSPGAWQQIGIAESRGDGLIGDIGLCLSPDGSSLEFGISLRASEQGKGLGTECVRGLIGLAFATASIATILARTDARNLACIAMLRNAGMRPAGEHLARYKGEECRELAFVAGRRNTP
jgi:RimJ/RimL family protein N-acetyltransferase